MPSLPAPATTMHFQRSVNSDAWRGVMTLLPSIFMPATVAPWPRRDDELALRPLAASFNLRLLQAGQACRSLDAVDVLLQDEVDPFIGVSDTCRSFATAWSSFSSGRRSRCPRTEEHQYTCPSAPWWECGPVGTETPRFPFDHGDILGPGTRCPDRARQPPPRRVAGRMMSLQPYLCFLVFMLIFSSFDDNGSSRRRISLRFSPPVAGSPVGACDGSMISTPPPRSPPRRAPPDLRRPARLGILQHDHAEGTGHADLLGSPLPESAPGGCG